MPDLDIGRRIKVLENAMPAISQIHDHLADAAIVIVDHPPNSCCQAGFHALPVLRSEMPDDGFHKIGEIDGIDVTAQAGLLPSGETKIVIGFDPAAGCLIAYVTP